MAKSKKNSTKSVRTATKPTKNHTPTKRRATAKASIGLEDIKKLPKAPGDYEDIAFRFADALKSTGFRGAPTSAASLRTMITRGRRLGKKAAALQLKFIEADRKRMVAESGAYKALLADWRIVQAHIPSRPDLATAFQFMSAWMSVTRAPAEPAPVPPAAPEP